MEITSIKITSCRRETGEAGGIAATARVVLNGMLALNGLRLMKGRYGYFLSFPSVHPGSPHRLYESVTDRFRKALQSRILREYEAALSRLPPM